MIKKFTAGSIALAFMFFLFGTAVNVFAAPPEDRASKNQACAHASEEGKANANENSVLSACEPIVEEPLVEETPTIDCANLFDFISNSEYCGG